MFGMAGRVVCRCKRSYSTAFRADDGEAFHLIVTHGRNGRMLVRAERAGTEVDGWHRWMLAHRAGLARTDRQIGKDGWRGSSPLPMRSRSRLWRDDPRLHVLRAVHALETRQGERLRAHADDVDIEQAGSVLGRQHAVLVPQQRGAQAPLQVLVAAFLDPQLEESIANYLDDCDRADSSPRPRGSGSAAGIGAEINFSVGCSDFFAS